MATQLCVGGNFGNHVRYMGNCGRLSYEAITSLLVAKVKRWVNMVSLALQLHVGDEYMADSIEN